jgi:hypothetical protein
MHKIPFAFLLSFLLLAIPLWGQEVFIKGNNQAAVQARTDFEKYTRYKLSGDASYAVLLVEEETWSPDFLSPATEAVTMKLISSRRELLWSKTEPIGSRSTETTIQGLLKDLAQAKPNLSGAGKKPAEAGERGHTGK